jgi:TonB family protein
MKAAHYLGVSLAVHAGLALLFLLLRAPQPAQTEEIRVILEFRPQDSFRSRESASRPAPAAARQRGALIPVFEPMGEIAIAPPEPAGRVDLDEVSRRVPAVQSRLPAPDPSAPAVIMPEATAVLDQVLSRVKGSRPAETEPVLAAGETELVWSGGGRRLLRQGSLSFPEILVREGQEVDVEASFLVSPDGRVTKVEITRSSGYILVDRAIERVLTEYLFEGSPEGEAEAGLIRFRFRLERPD